MHPVNITVDNVNEVQKCYQILASSDRVPQIVEHFNSISTQFNLNHVQPQSLLLLKNFIAFQLKRMSIEGKIGVRLTALNFGQNSPIILKKRAPNIK